MNTDEIKDKIREIARYNTIGLSRHCRKRMRERNVTMDDLLYVLMWGVVTDVEHADDDAIRCTVRGDDLDGDELNLVAALNIREHIICITVF